MTYRTTTSKTGSKNSIKSIDTIIELSKSEIIHLDPMFNRIIANESLGKSRIKIVFGFGGQKNLPVPAISKL